MFLEALVLLSFIAILCLVFRPRPDPTTRRVTGTRNSRERGFGDGPY